MELHAVLSASAKSGTFEFAVCQFVRSLPPLKKKDSESQSRLLVGDEEGRLGGAELVVGIEAVAGACEELVGAFEEPG